MCNERYYVITGECRKLHNAELHNCVRNTGGVNTGERRINYIRFTDDISLLAEDERMLKDMLMELNDICEDYGVKININKTKIMVIGRKPNKIDMRELCELKINPLNKWTASNTWGAISVAT